MSLQIQRKTNWQVVVVPTIRCGSTLKFILKLENIFLFGTAKKRKVNSYPTAKVRRRIHIPDPLTAE